MLNRLNTQKRSYWQTLPTLLLAMIFTSNTGAKAEPRAVDVFSVNTATQSNQKAKAKNQVIQNDSAASAAAVWFEKLDQLRQQNHPSERDKVILTRPLMQDAARVQQWTDTASKVSKSYLSIGQIH